MRTKDEARNVARISQGRLKIGVVGSAAKDLRLQIMHTALSSSCDSNLRDEKHAVRA